MFSREDRDSLVEVINRYLSDGLTAFKLDEALSDIGAKTKDETVKQVADLRNTVQAAGVFLDGIHDSSRWSIMCQFLGFHHPPAPGLGAQGAQPSFDVAQALAAGQSREVPDQELFVAGPRAEVSPTPSLGRFHLPVTTDEIVGGTVVQELG